MFLVQNNKQTNFSSPICCGWHYVIDMCDLNSRLNLSIDNLYKDFWLFLGIFLRLTYPAHFSSISDPPQHNSLLEEESWLALYLGHLLFAYFLFLFFQFFFTI